MPPSRFALMAACVFIAFVASTARVSATIITNQATFNALYSGLTTNSFEGFVAPGLNGSLSNPFVVSGASIASTIAVVAVDREFSNPNIPAGPSDFLHAGFNGGVFTIDLDPGTNVVGFNLGELLNGDTTSSGSVSVDVFADGNHVFGETYTTANVGLFSTFFGIANMGNLSRVVIDSQNSSGTAALDNLTVGTLSTVPEPATLALMVLGLAGFGLRRRHLN